MEVLRFTVSKDSNHVTNSSDVSSLDANNKVLNPLPANSPRSDEVVSISPESSSGRKYWWKLNYALFITNRDKTTISSWQMLCNVDQTKGHVTFIWTWWGHFSKLKLKWCLALLELTVNCPKLIVLFWRCRNRNPKELISGILDPCIQGRPQRRSKSRGCPKKHNNCCAINFANSTSVS